LHRQDGIVKLKPNAIPTLFDVPNPPARLDTNRKSVYKVFNIHTYNFMTFFNHYNTMQYAYCDSYKILTTNLQHTWQVITLHTKT